MAWPIPTKVQTTSSIKPEVHNAIQSVTYERLVRCFRFVYFMLVLYDFLCCYRVSVNKDLYITFIATPTKDSLSRAIGNMRASLEKIGHVDMPANKHTHTHDKRHPQPITPLPYWGRVTNRQKDEELTLIVDHAAEVNHKEVGTAERTEGRSTSCAVRSWSRR